MHGTVPAESGSPIRPITVDDMDWVMELLRVHYRETDYDEAAVRSWVAARLREPSMHFVRGERCAGVCHLAVRYMAPGRQQAYLTVITSMPQVGLSLEPFRVFQELVRWAKQVGATKFWASDVTGYDLGAWARAMGGREAGKNYVIDLDDKGGRYG